MTTKYCDHADEALYNRYIHTLSAVVLRLEAVDALLDHNPVLARKQLQRTRTYVRDQWVAERTCEEGNDVNQSDRSSDKDT